MGYKKSRRATTTRKRNQAVNKYISFLCKSDHDEYQELV